MTSEMKKPIVTLPGTIGIVLSWLLLFSAAGLFLGKIFANAFPELWEMVGEPQKLTLMLVFGAVGLTQW